MADHPIIISQDEIKTAETLVFPPDFFFSNYILSRPVSRCIWKRKTRRFFFSADFYKGSQPDVSSSLRQEQWAHFLLPNPLFPLSSEKNILGLFGHMDRIYSHTDMYRVCVKNMI